MLLQFLFQNCFLDIDILDIFRFLLFVIQYVYKNIIILADQSLPVL